MDLYPSFMPEESKDHENPLDNLVQQNFNPSFMRQMQQQLNNPIGGNSNNATTSTQAALGTLQNGLNNINANALMNALQGGAPPAPGQQNTGQQSAPSPFFDVKNAENAILAALAAANNQQQGSNGPGMSVGMSVSDTHPNQQQQQQQQQQPQQQLPQHHQLSQPTGGAFSLENLDQLRDFNPLAQQTPNPQQNTSSDFPDLRRQSLGGFGGLGQQLATELQQQANQQQQQQQPQHIALQQQQQQQIQQQQNQMYQQQQNQFNQQNQPQQAQFQQQQQNQLGGPWMGQNVNMNMNPASFGDASFLNPATAVGKNPAMSLPNNMAVFGDQGNNTLSQEIFGGPIQPQNNPSQAAGLLGFGGVGANNAFAGMQFQPPPAKRRSSSISSGSLSPIGKQKNMVSNVASNSQVATFAHLFPPSFSNPTPSNNEQEDPAETKQPRKILKKRSKSFPEKLMAAMTENSDEEAVAWLPDGKSFVIVNPDLFCDEVLNKVFKESKYSSFVRKLHRWGFVRLTSGTGTDCFHHPMFQRNKREMAGKITCNPRGAEKEKTDPPTATTAAATSEKSSSDRGSKPPSLAGVEKFIRAKVVAAASAAANAEEAGLLLKQEDDDDEVPDI